MKRQKELRKKNKKRGGEQAMMLRRLLVVVLMVVIGTTISCAQGSDSDTFIITLTPAFTYDIRITTDGASSIGIQIDTLSHVYYSTSSVNDATNISTATVYNDSNVSVDWTIAAAITAGGGNPWKLGSIDTGTVDIDSITLCVVLEDIADGGSHDNIDESDFTSNDLVAEGTTHNMDDSHFVVQGANADDSGNNVGVGEARVMWYRIKAPSDISNTAAQSIRFTMIAQSAGTF